MSAKVSLERVPLTDLVLAIVLLVGVLLIGHGYFHTSAFFFYSGLFIVIGGVISGIIRIVTR